MTTSVLFLAAHLAVGLVFFLPVARLYKLSGYSVKNQVLIGIAGVTLWPFWIVVAAWFLTYCWSKDGRPTHP